MDYRSVFKQILVRYLNDPRLENIDKELRELSIAATPSLLYRYRKCTQRHFSELENEVLTFSAPVVFDDDPEDAFVSMENDRIDKLRDLAAGTILPTLSDLAQMNQENRNNAMSKILFSDGREVDLFEGVVPPNKTWNNAFFSSLTNEEKTRYVTETFNDILNIISERDACARIRNLTKVACLCEDPNSAQMWDEYGDEGTGFQLEYSKEALFGMGASGITTPLIFPVIYEDKRPDMSELAMIFALEDSGFQFLPGNTLMNRYRFAYMLAAIYIKNHALFSHEEEWRIMIPDHSTNEAHRPYATRLCPINQIILGKRTSHQDKAILRKIAAKLSVPITEQGDEKICAHFES